jgi:metal-responsive CopG/Arc/MetJ family transcriptional regulator
MAKVLVNFQDEFLQDIDKIAELEHRTRSSLIREALRRYLLQYKTEAAKKETQSQQTSQSIDNKIIFPATKAS